MLNKHENAMSAIEHDQAKFIGESKWIKDSAYQIYEYENKYYSIIVHDSQSKWILDDSIEEINQSDIDEYLN